MTSNAGYKKESFLEFPNNETASFKKSSGDEEPVTSCTSLPALPSASLRSCPLLYKQVCLKYCLCYMVCCSTNKVIQIQNIFSLSILVMSETFPSQVLSAASREADPSSIAVGYIFRDVSPKTMNSVPVSFFAGPGNEIIYIALPTSFRQRSPRYFLSITS